MKKWNYYNEFDPKSAAWIRELIKQKLIPEGEVDERSITEVQPGDVRGFVQCHWFAGICGWPLALALAGWDPTRPVWTGSCPCQPFSSAGKHLAQADKRHLWPAFFNLIRECRPERVFGEQVASAIGKGWLDGISADLEGEGYACGAVVLGAHSVGAPHLRQRLYWVADASGERCAARSGTAGSALSEGVPGNQSQSDGIVGRMADSDKLNGHRTGLGASDDRALGGAGPIQGQHDLCRLADAAGERGAQQLDQPGSGSRRPPSPAHSAECAGSCGVEHSALSESERLRSLQKHLSGSAAWACFDILPCTDGKTRRVESGSFPLADGLPGRVGLLRGYGNAIVPQTAAEFVMAFDDIHTANNETSPSTGATEKQNDG